MTGDNDMALVFLSCGQREGEKEIAKQIEQMIKADFGMGCYNADSVQGFDDVMSITEHLSKADYYLFVDFKRKRVKGDLEISVFTHQEFAMARAWGIKEMIAFQEEGLKSYGMLSSLLVHPTKFTNRDQLVRLVREEIRRRGWNNNYSRNLVVFKIEPSGGLIEFTDHTGTSVERVWFLWVQNHRDDRSAFDTVAILHSVRNEATGQRTRCKDSSYLKWAGQKGFHKTIFPQDFATFSAFAVRVNQPGVFLHSAADVPRQPIISEIGSYKLEYRIFSESFPPVNATVALNYVGPLGMEIQILSSTSADLLN
jgi:hypothetical protein